MINATEILQDQLAHSLGLDRYADIMRGDPSTPEFQHTFNGFYRVRRNWDWQRQYYSLFNKAREGQYSFERIITELYQLTGNVEASFSSKLLATIDASKPIWDRFVLRKTKEEKLMNAVALYHRIEMWYADYLNTAEAKQNIKSFDRLLPKYAWLSATKKIDCLLWSKRDKNV